ncbi:MAG: efflux RND transporter periplasmic adaptor subunit, partial [Bacteroidota bacterium]
MKKNIINSPLWIICSLIIGGVIGFFLNNQLTKSEYSNIEQSTHPHIEESTHQTIEESSNQQIYTCSMHPQIRQNEEGICPICEMDLIPLEANTSNDPLVLEMTKEAVKLANIQTTVVGEGTQNSSAIIRLSGKVQADERRASSQVSHLAGRIEKLYISFTGEQVRKGQKLADIYAPELITAQRELLEAKKLVDINPQLV